MSNEMSVEEFKIMHLRPNPEGFFQKIELVGEINGQTVVLDPFVSCHLELVNALKWIGKSIKFTGWKNESGCYLVREVLSVE